MKTLKNSTSQHLPILIVLTIALIVAPIAWACMGTSQPPKCSRAIYLAKFSQGNVVFPTPTRATQVPVGVLPFVSWDSADKRCAQPVSAQIVLTFTCTPVGGGAAVVVGPQTFPVAKPTKPGQQPMPPLNFTIPANTLTGPGPFRCLVRGTYTVTFGGAGPGSGPLSGTGDVTVCLVPPSDAYPKLPRLDVRYLPLDPKGLARTVTCRRGDQGTLFFLVSNNDANEVATLNLSSSGTQAARLPDGFSSGNPSAAFNAFVHAISSPVPGTDVFPAVFADTLATGQLIPEPDPTLVDPFTIARNIVLQPLESTIVAIAIRSHGMCADGSCSERSLEATGFFGPQVDNDLALGCASTALVVGNSAKPKSPLAEFADEIKVGPKEDAFFSPGTFGDTGGPIDHAMTFGMGNQPPGQPARTQLTSTPLNNAFHTFPNIFPSKVTDTLRTEHEPTTFSYSIEGFTAPQFNQVTNNVVLNGINEIPINGRFAMPFINLPANGNGTLNINVTGVGADDMVAITGAASFTGTMKQLKGSPLFLVDTTTCRTLTRTGDLDGKVIAADPPGISHSTDRPGCLSFFDVVCNGPDLGQKWFTKLQPLNGVALYGGTSGQLKTPNILIDTLRPTNPNSPDNISVANIVVIGAVNSPLQVPIHTRELPNVCIEDTAGFGSLKLNLTTGEFTATGSNVFRGSGTGKVTIKNGIATFVGTGTEDSGTVVFDRAVRVTAEITLGGPNRGAGMASVSFNGDAGTTISDATSLVNP